MSGAASAEIRVYGRVLEAKFRGVVTPVGLLTYRREVLEPHQGGLDGVVGCFVRATVAVDEVTLLDGFGNPEVRRRFGTAAVICRPEDLPMFRRYAARVAQFGVTRVPFLDAEQAHEWIARRARAANSIATYSRVGIGLN